MANKVTMNICGQEYTLVADESAAYMEKVGALVDERMRQVLDALHVSQTDAAVLAAVNLADELLKNQAAAENLRRQVKNYLDEATQAKNEASELKRQLFKAQQGNPFQSAQALITFIGICMLLDGVINLWNAFVVWQHLRVLKKAASAAIDTIAAAVDAANGNAPADVVVDAVSTADAPAEEPTAEQPVEENTPNE